MLFPFSSYSSKITLGNSADFEYFCGSYKKESMKDLFDKIYKDKGPLGKWAEQAEGYFVFPKLEGEISNRMKFRGKEVITWSINDYLGLANHPEVRKVDAEAAKQYGSAYPMGARMMSGQD